MKEIEMKKRLKAFEKLNEALSEKKVTRFCQRKVGKRWLYSTSVLIALASGVGIVNTTHPEFMASIVYALTLPPGSNQIGSIGSAPVIQTNNNSFSSLQSLFDSLIGTQQPEYIAGDTIDGSGGKNVGWHAGTSYVGTTITNANSQLNGANGLSYWTIHYGLKANDGFQDGDKFNYVTQGQRLAIKNVGTAYNTSTKQNVSIGMELRFNSATYYDSPTSTTPRDVFGDGYRLLVAARNNNGNITLGYMISMDGIPNPGTGQGSEGGGPGGTGGDTLGAASGIPESVGVTVQLYDMATGQNLPANTLTAMKVSDIDAGQAAQVFDINQLGYIISKPTNLEIVNNILTAKGNNTVVDDPQSLNPNSYIVLYNGASTAVNYQDTNGNQKQGSIVQALFGNMGPTSPRQPLGYIAINKSTLQYGTSFPNNLYNFKDLSFQVLDKNNKVVDTITLDNLGNGKSKGLPPGDYTLHEISGKWDATGQTVRPDQTITVKPGETITTTPKNTAVTGQITIIKKGVESGDAMWNGNYTLEGNKFKLTSLTDGRVYTATTDKGGQASLKDLPLGKYKVEETAASDGFVNAFKPVEVEIKYKDQNTEVVFGEAKGDNKEIKGQNKLQKSDKETGVDQNGKAVMKDAKYGWFHDDVSTGSSPHKVGDPVKWTEKPNPQLLTGEKVTSAVIGGVLTDFGDNVVVKVSDDKFEAAVGNLAAGKYYVQELDVGEGYTTDPTKHKFEIKKKDDQTQIIVTDDSKSQEQVIKARITLDKMVTLPGNQGGSGYNGVEFIAQSLTGNSKDVQFVTGVNPNTGDDGWAQQDLVYDDWKIYESKGVPGYEDIKPVYIHMETDPEKDLLTISASYYEDFSKPFSKRTFSLKDSSTSSHPNGDGTIGEVTPDLPTISLSTLHFNDNPIPEPIPSIDIEKADDKTPNPGEGNHSDKLNNVGVNDHDTEDTALEVTYDKETAIKFRFTNNGTEALTHLKVLDKTIEGGVSIKDLVWFFKGEKLSANEKGEITTQDGKLLVLQPDEFVTGEGTLPVLSEGKLHGDEATVSGIGVESGKEVEDADRWYGRPQAVEPSIDIEKADSKQPIAGDGNHEDKPNNVGVHDHDTEETVKELLAKDKTTLFFTATNNGTEALTHVKVEDKTIAGHVDMKNIVWTYKGNALKVNKEGALVTQDDKLLELQPKESIQGKGQLESLPPGELHGNEVSIEARGTHSGKEVGDEDKWYGKVPKEKLEASKPNKPLPLTGEEKAAYGVLAGLGFLLMVLVAVNREKSKLFLLKSKNNKY
jgi:hypothetical protein